LRGTGSWIAAQIARTGRVLIEQGRRVQIVFIDPDRVSAANVPRSCFCEQEIGELKAVALARRYSGAWALEIGTITEHFTPEMARPSPNEDALNVVVGCVDNAAARGALADVLARRTHYGYYDYSSRGQTILIDCGNTRDGGQVLVGTVTRTEEMRGSFKGSSICTELPSPMWQHPELLEELEEERPDHNLSCAELMMRNAQDLMVNHFVASITGDYLMRLLVTKYLRRYATYFDLEACSTRNKYITPDGIAQAVNCETEFLTSDGTLAVAARKKVMISTRTTSTRLRMRNLMRWLRRPESSRLGFSQ
jgi:PRTRC genetic system ThiF family protein